MDHTDLLRLATRKDAKDYIEQNFDLRGVPIKSHFRLDPHQVEALNWMRQREKVEQCGIRGGMVCMTMGLGKTFTALTHILSAPIGEYPTLVIMSKTLLQEWKQQGIEKFFDFSIKALYFHKDYLGNDMKKIKIKDIKKYDIVLTTYDVCMNICKKKGYHDDEDSKITECCTKNIAVDRGDAKISGPAVLYCIPWNRIVCDESQRFANHKTLTYKSMMALCGKYKWCLTGTPIRNYHTDIWAQFRFLGYSTVKTSAQWKATGFERMDNENLRDVILTMNYDDANMHLVPKHHKEIRKELSGNQQKVYETILRITQDVYDMMLDKLCSWSCVLAMFTRLRQCVIAPYLLTAESKRSDKVKKTVNAAQEYMEEFEATDMYKWCCDKKGEAGIHSVKIEELMGILQSIPKNEKVIVFSIFTSALDLVAAAMEDRMPDTQFLQVDGDVAGSERSELLNQFRDDRETKVLLLT
jgi:SNF2 family DNA or RNA helicase